MSAECQILERALCPASVKIIAIQVTGRYSPSLKQFSQELIEDPVSEFIIAEKMLPAKARKAAGGVIRVGVSKDKESTVVAYA